MARHTKNNPINRKPVDRETKNPEVLIGRGNLSVSDKQLLTMLLGRFGVSTEHVRATDYNEREQKLALFLQTKSFLEAQQEVESTLKFSFSEISRPDQFMVREHFEDFRKNYGKDSLPRNFVGKTFHHLVDGNGSSRTWHWEHSSSGGNRFKVFRDPLPLAGAIIAKRSDLGIEPYPAQLEYFGKSQFCAEYAIQAGSLLEFADAFKEIPLNELNAPQKGILLVAFRLKTQFAAESE
ncbi:MAG TPA: hypothetical protein VLG25_00875 [Patescibacteria group bacterium]|nr:hypothetical protein [Patescibacteria group bacterium]